MEAPSSGSGESFSGLAETIGNASPAVMLAMFILALVRRWFVLPRELDQSYKRITELELERDEYKAMLFRALDVSERITAAVEERSKK
jgi:hypothetical protein